MGILIALLIALPQPNVVISGRLRNITLDTIRERAE